MPQPGDPDTHTRLEGQDWDRVQPGNGREGREINGMESSVVDEGVIFNNLLVASLTIPAWLVVQKNFVMDDKTHVTSLLSIVYCYVLLNGWFKATFSR